MVGPFPRRRAVVACALLAAPRLAAAQRARRLQKGPNGGKKPPPGGSPPAHDDGWEEDGDEDEEWDDEEWGDCEDWDEGCEDWDEGEAYGYGHGGYGYGHGDERRDEGEEWRGGKEGNLEGHEWCLWEVTAEFVNFGVNGGRCFGCSGMADEEELVAHCRELCLKDADCVAFETAPDGVDFYESEFEGKRYYLDGFDHNGVNCCLEHHTSSNKGSPNSWQRSGDVDGDCPAEVSLWTTRELVEGEAEFCDRDYALDLGVCTAYAEYDFDDSEDANVARRDLYLERGCAAIDDGFYYFILAMCFLAGALVTFLAAACWIFDALQDQERKSRLRAGTCVVVVASALVWFFGLLPAVYWLPPVYELSYAGAGVGLVLGLAAHAKPVKKRLLPRVDGRTYCVSPAGDVARVEAEMVPAIEAVPVDRSPVVVDGRRELDGGRDEEKEERSPVARSLTPSKAIMAESLRSVPRAGDDAYDVFISHCKKLPTSEDRAIWLADLCVENKYSNRLQCARIRRFRREAFCCASRTQQEQSICPKISRIDFDLTELESSEVWLGYPAHCLISTQADLFEGEGLKVFFDRSDLLEISEAALRDAVRASRVIVTVVDPVTFDSVWVANENAWAKDLGKPIVAFYDRDRHAWDEISKWVPLHPHVFARQAIPYTKDYRTEAKDKLLRQVDLARRDATVRGHAALKGLHAAGSATF